ncbi:MULTISPECIES: hypothetical protein [unclassified Saccharothrix]|uniref:hypothetical protein n=1 Tax=unclassified Saccharothrix TaxID=2593673 RepID=UPI00307D37CF
MTKQRMGPLVIEDVRGRRVRRVALVSALVFCLITAPEASARVMRAVLESLIEFAQNL